MTQTTKTTETAHASLAAAHIKLQQAIEAGDARTALKLHTEITEREIAVQIADVSARRDADATAKIEADRRAGAADEAIQAQATAEDEYRAAIEAFAAAGAALVTAGFAAKKALQVLQRASTLAGSAAHAAGRAYEPTRADWITMNTAADQSFRRAVQTDDGMLLNIGALQQPHALSAFLP